MDVGGRKEDVDSCQVEYTSMVVFKDFVSCKSVCSPETFDFIYPSKWHGKEE